MIKVLQLCKKSPLPTKDGESLAIHQITKAFALHNFHVDVLSMLTPKHQEHSTESNLENVNYYTVNVDTRPTKWAAFKNLFSIKPYIVERFYSQSFADKLQDLLQQNNYDYIVLEGVFLGLYINLIKKHTQAKLILRSHNVEHQIWERLAENEQYWAKKAYLNGIMNKRLKAYENNIVQQIDAIIPISPLDEAYFKQLKDLKSLTVPVCFEQQEAKTLPLSFTLGFLGGMDWQPNSDGVTWFIHEVWKPFVEKYPDAIFNLAGRNFPKDKRTFEDKGVFIHGEIENASDFIANQRIMIVPLFSGSGMRVKIIEAMNLGRCVLSTAIGAEGIQYTENENIVIANDKKSWFLALEKLYHSPLKVSQIADEAKHLIEQNYDTKTQAKALVNFIQKL